MDERINQKKLDEMWARILQYEKSEGLNKNKNTSVQKLVSIIDEVFRQCY